MEPLFTVVQ